MWMGGSQMRTLIPARISHQVSPTAGDAPHPAVFSRLSVLDVRSSTPPLPSGRKPHWVRHLAALATKPGKIFGLVLLLTIPSMIGQAAEGMWLPDQLPKIGAALEAAGLKTPPENFADLTGDPMGAIVSLGGCSASFVSPEGLVVTNHHCAYGTIQFNSTEEHNFLEDGFLAAGQLHGGAQLPRRRLSGRRPRG